MLKLALQSRMNRRAFLKSIPLLGGMPLLGNALAYGSNHLLVPEPGPRFFRWISLEGGKQALAFEDLWDPAFQAYCRSIARNFGQQNPGFPNAETASDIPTPTWNLTRARQERENDWVSFTRQLPGESPGKRQYVSFLLRRYSHDLKRINYRYGANVRHPNQLLSHPFIKVDLQNPAIYKDDAAFLEIIQQQWNLELAELFPCNSRSWRAKNATFATRDASQSRFAIL